MARRSFVRKSGAGFDGWGCSACEWVHPYKPRSSDSGAEAIRAFDEHKCENHSKRNLREDVARIVREDTGREN